MLKKINRQWVLGIAASVVAAGILSFIGWFFGDWGVILVWLKTVYEFLIYRVSLPIWLLAILISVSSGSLLIFFIAWTKSKRKPPWIRYTEDVFDGLRWRWEYSGKNPKHFYPYCPNDDTKFNIDERAGIFDPTTTFLICDTCRREWGPFKGFFHNYQEKIYRQVELKIRNGEWKKVMEEKRKKASTI